MSSIRADEQRLDVGTVVSLYTIDASAIGGGVHRFTPGVRTGAPLAYGGLEYRALPIELAGVDYRTGGQASRPTLTVSRLDEPFVAAALAVDDFRGATLRRVRTLERWLDGAPEADPERHWPEERWRIEALERRERERMTWRLASPLDLEGLKLPRRQVLRDPCSWTYRRWDAVAGAWDYSEATCPYTGDAYFDAKDRPVSFSPPIAGARYDRCSRRLSGCRARFPDDDLPFGGFIGVGRTIPRRR